MEKKAEGRTIYNLDSTELALLEYYANNSMGKAGSMARGILEYTSNGHFCHCPGSQPTWFKQSKPFSKTFADRGIKVTVQPNPTNDYIIVSYIIEKGNTACLSITDMTGKHLQTIGIKPEVNQKVLSLSRYSGGNYFVTLIVDGHSVETIMFTLLK
jgi:hypothetical protein